VAELFIITASRPAAYKHYTTSIASPLSRDLLKRYLPPPEFQKVESIFGNAPIHAWGATSGKRNVGNWQRLRPEDYVLVYVQGKFVNLARVAYKLPHPQLELARMLWGTQDGETWEYVYFLKDVRKINYHIDRFCDDLVGYSHRFYPQGLMRIPRNKYEPRFGTLERFLEHCTKAM